MMETQYLEFIFYVHMFQQIIYNYLFSSVHLVFNHFGNLPLIQTIKSMSKVTDADIKSHYTVCW